jgi:hypothetical protein
MIARMEGMTLEEFTAGFRLFTLAHMHDSFFVHYEVLVEIVLIVDRLVGARAPCDPDRAAVARCRAKT